MNHGLNHYHLSASTAAESVKTRSSDVLTVFFIEKLEKQELQISLKAVLAAGRRDLVCGIGRPSSFRPSGP